MSGGSMKLAARQVLELPLPLDRAAWEHGAVLLTRMYTGHDPDNGASENLAHRWVEFGRVMNSAWGVVDTSLPRVVAGPAPERNDGPRPMTAMMTSTSRVARFAGSGNLGRTPKVPPPKRKQRLRSPTRDAVGSAGNEVSGALGGGNSD